MKPHKISFVNAMTLISFGLWGYFDGDAEKNITALIPVFFGIIMFSMFKGGCRTQGFALRPESSLVTPLRNHRFDSEKT